MSRLTHDTSQHSTPGSRTQPYPTPIRGTGLGVALGPGPDILLDLWRQMTRAERGNEHKIKEHLPNLKLTAPWTH